VPEIVVPVSLLDERGIKTISARNKSITEKTNTSTIILFISIPPFKNFPAINSVLI
jgi:hypothetical protein